jgi:hypothetical protein
VTPLGSAHLALLRRARAIGHTRALSWYGPGAGHLARALEARGLVALARAGRGWRLTPVTASETVIPSMRNVYRVPQCMHSGFYVYLPVKRGKHDTAVIARGIGNQ